MNIMQGIFGSCDIVAELIKEGDNDASASIVFDHPTLGVELEIVVRRHDPARDPVETADRAVVDIPTQED